MKNKTNSLSWIFASGLLVLFLVSLFFPSQSIAEVKRTTRVESRQLRASDSGFACMVQMQAIKPSLTDNEAETWWGALGKETFPQSSNYAVSHMVIQYQNQSIFIPVTVYSALANVNKVTVRKTITGCEIALRGGDGSTSYTAILLVKRVGRVYALKQRIVRHGEAPNKWWEITTFSDPYQMP